MTFLIKSLRDEPNLFEVKSIKDLIEDTKKNWKVKRDIKVSCGYTPVFGMIAATVLITFPLANNPDRVITKSAPVQIQ